MKDPVKVASSEDMSRQNSAALSPVKRNQKAQAAGSRSSAKRGGAPEQHESHEVTAILVLEYKPPADLNPLHDLNGRRCASGPLK